jgi:hypothetical protein
MLFVLEALGLCFLQIKKLRCFILRLRRKMDTTVTDYDSDTTSEVYESLFEPTPATPHPDLLDDAFSLSDLPSDLQQELDDLDTDSDSDEDEDMSFENAAPNPTIRPPPPTPPSLIMPASQLGLIDIYHRQKYNTFPTLLYRAPKIALVSLSRTCYHRLVTQGHPVIQFSGGNRDIFRYALRWIVRVASINESGNNASKSSVELGVKANGFPIPYSGTTPILTLLQIKAVAGKKGLDCRILEKVCEREIPKFVASNGIRGGEMEAILEYTERGDDGWDVIVGFVAKEIFERRMEWDDVNALELIDGAEGFGNDVREAVEMLRIKNRLEWPLIWDGHEEWVKEMEEKYPLPTRERVEELKEEAAKRWDPKMAYPEKYFRSKGKGKVTMKDTKDNGEEEALEIRCWYRGELSSVAEVEKRQR